MLPLFLRLDGHLTVVVGGGPVGRRKAHTLLAAGATVRVICLEPRPGDESNERLDWRTEPYRPDHLGGAALAVAAATPEVNRRVAADAWARGLWVNVTDDPSAGNLTFPATVRHSDFVIAVGTGGAAPALARRVRERLEAEFDEAFGAWVELLAELRPQVGERVADPRKRRAVYERLTEWHWLDRLRAAGRERVRAELLAEVARLTGESL